MYFYVNCVSIYTYICGRNRIGHSSNLYSVCVKYSVEAVDAVVINSGTFSWGTTDADVGILKKYVEFVLCTLQLLLHRSTHGGHTIICCRIVVFTLQQISQFSLL